MFEKIALAIGLVLVVEGAAYALFPTLLRTMVEMMKNMSDSELRYGGLMALAFGVFLVWLAN
jgi:uncharacterized protein YjeT (DUF2065 family)